MKYLLDVNALIALAHTQHIHHARAIQWYRENPGSVIGVCSITELGFVRVSVQAGLQPDVATARTALVKLKASGKPPFEFWNDSLGVDTLPAYVKKPTQVTDGHLLVLARAQGARLATLDTGITGAEIIG